MKYPKDGSFAEVMSYVMRAKRYEPAPRIKDTERRGRGMRNLPVSPSKHPHRFEIIGGISANQVMAENIMKSTPLLDRLLKKK